MYRNITHNAIVSVVQAIISGAVLFLLYRYLIAHLGAEQLGLWSVILSSTSVARLSDMGLAGSVVKFVARYRALKDDRQAADVVQTAAISIAVAMAILVLPVYPLLNVVLGFTIPEAAIPQAMDILPWAVFSLWLGSVGGVFQSGLDGCQRMDIRNGLMIAGNLLFLIAAILLVPHYGLLGLAVAQVAQGFVLMVASWLVLRKQIPALPWVPSCWSKAKFTEMFGYAANFQISAFAILLFEPITKLLMSRYGGLSSAAYYEMANQLVVKLRGVLIAANQALVPAVAELHEISPGGIRDLYLKVYCLLFFVTMPFFATILIALPTVSVLWLGHVEVQFVLFGTMLAASWGFNSLTTPAYFMNLGTGDLKWNSIAHVLMAILNVPLGFILGKMMGGTGVAASAALALVVASYVILFAFHKQYVISLRSLVPSEHYLLSLVVMFLIALAVLTNSLKPFGPSDALNGAISLGVCLLSTGIVMWLHPYRRMLLGRLRERRNNSIST